MKSREWKWIALGIAAGAFLGLPGFGYVLVFYGFWDGLMFVLPALGIATVLVLRTQKRGVFLALRAGLGSFTGFGILFPLLTLDPGEGSPVSATLVGAWMSAWIVIIVALVTYQVLIIRKPPVGEMAGGNSKGHGS